MHPGSSGLQQPGGGDNIGKGGGYAGAQGGYAGAQPDQGLTRIQSQVSLCGAAWAFSVALQRLL